MRPTDDADQRIQVMTLIDGVDPHAVAVTTAEASSTWVELERRARCLGRALDSAGICEGRAWAVLAHNRIEWAEIGLGTGRAGARVVPLNWHLTSAELAGLLRDSGASLVVCEPELAHVAREAANAAAIARIIELGDEYEAWLDHAGDAPLTERPVGSPMVFTGGTTGRSKGVTRSDSTGDASEWSRRWSGWGRLVRLPEGGRTLVTIPLYHALGNGVFCASLASGVPVHIASKFDAEVTLALIESLGVTSMPMVPTQFVRLLKLDDDVRERYDVSSLRWVLHSAAPCPEWAKRAMIDWFGPVIYELYGSSEGTGPAVCDSEEWLAHPGTVGRATAVLDFSIVDDAGNDLPPGEIGTIYCKRLDGTPEYHNDPEKTAAMVLPDGRFTVGDLGWLDEDGYLYLADRRVDLIITGGANVYPAEIEAVLIEHPQIGDIAVFGIPDHEWGQQIKAVIEPADPGVDVDVDDVRSFARARLASYKVPSSFDVVDALPREAHGKLKKRLLRDPYWEQPD